jgi:hypothetical protein
MIVAPWRDRFLGLPVQQARSYNAGEHTANVDLRGTTPRWIHEKHTAFREEKQPCEAYVGTVEHIVARKS